MTGIDERYFEDAITSDRVFNRGETTILRAYMASKENGYQYLVAQESFWDCKPDEIYGAMGDAGVDRFVLADKSTALMAMIHMFTHGGYRMATPVEISQEKKERYNPEYDKPIQGLLFEKF